MNQRARDDESDKNQGKDACALREASKGGQRDIRRLVGRVQIEAQGNVKLFHWSQPAFAQRRCQLIETLSHRAELRARVQTVHNCECAEVSRKTLRVRYCLHANAVTSASIQLNERMETIVGKNPRGSNGERLLIPQRTTQLDKM
jgi:hypothetical protein